MILDGVRAPAGVLADSDARSAVAPDTIVWGNRTGSWSDSLVWGSTIIWSSRDTGANTIIWGNRGGSVEGDTIIWGNRGSGVEGDTIIWGDRARDGGAILGNTITPGSHSGSDSAGTTFGAN